MLFKCEKFYPVTRVTDDLIYFWDYDYLEHIFILKDDLELINPKLWLKIDEESL